MKKAFLTLLAAGVALVAAAQPQLSKDNIEDVLKAMTLQEKATLLVGGARAAVVNGVTSGVDWNVPGAAGNTRPIERLGIPGTVLAVRELATPSIAPASRWVRCWQAPGT